MKSVYGILCVFFIGIAQAQQLPAALALETPAGFHFHRPVSSLRVIAAAQAAEELREAREVVAKKSPEQLSAAQAVLDTAEKKLASWSDGELRLLNFMGRYKTPQEGIEGAIRANDRELLMFALVSEHIFNQSVVGKRWVEQCFKGAAITAIEYHKKPADSNKLTLVEELLLRAHNISQNTRDRLLKEADTRGKADLIPLLLYGRVITLGGEPYSVGGGARGEFVDRWPAHSLHKIIATGNADGESAADPHDLRHKELKLALDERSAWRQDIEKKTLQAVKKALDAGADVNQLDGFRNSPLHVAAKYSTPAIFKLLLARGAQIDARDAFGWTPLHRTARYGQTDIVSVMQSHGAPIDAEDEDEMTPLHRAAENGQTETAGVLLDCGASIDASDKRGQKPLHCAAEKGHLEAVNLLLDRGAPIETINFYGLTPLHCAAATGKTEIVCLLVLERKANIDARDRQGKAPLHRAILGCAIDTVGALLTLGASIDAQDNEGKTPLHLAAQASYTQIVRVLLAHGANPCILDKTGKNALDYSQNEEIRALLEDAMTANKLCIFL